MNRLKYIWRTIRQRYYIVRQKIKVYDKPQDGIAGEITEAKYLKVNMDEVRNEWVSCPSKANLCGFFSAVIIRFIFIRQDKKKKISGYEYCLESFADAALVYYSMNGEKLKPIEE